MSQILLVEDERHLAEGLAFNLRNAGYPVQIAESGEEALDLIEGSPEFDLVLLDVMLPGISGIEVARRLRRQGFTRSILMVSARGRGSDKIAGLDAGADDYITKPYDLDEVLARIRGALRRQIWEVRSNGVETDSPPRSLKFGRWTVDFPTFQARAGDETLELSPKEVGILQLFAARPEEVIRRETFLEKVWDVPGTLETRTVDNFIRRLRQALEEEPSRPRHILSVRGAGYRFVP